MFARISVSYCLSYVSVMYNVFLLDRSRGFEFNFSSGVFSTDSLFLRECVAAVTPQCSLTAIIS